MESPHRFAPLSVPGDYWKLDKLPSISAPFTFAYCASFSNAALLFRAIRDRFDGASVPPEEGVTYLNRQGAAPSRRIFSRAHAAKGEGDK